MARTSTVSKLLICLIMSAFVRSADAGIDTSSSKEVQPAPAPPPANWYRDTEWNISAWFAYGFPGTVNDRTSLTDTLSAPPGPGTYDRFLADEHAYGGGLEAKYFFHRYFGIGIEGFALKADGVSYTAENAGAIAFKGPHDRILGGPLATATLRYPIGQSRFAPYVWAGGGALFDGRDESAIYTGGVIDRILHRDEMRGVGQFGGGLEIRLTPHVGLISDCSWNVVDGPTNNFGLVRTGVNIAF
ncbi:MAG TPA: hypothetical protein VGM62_00105 [Chthoniobacterales bacterium]